MKFPSVIRRVLLLLWLCVPSVRASTPIISYFNPQVGSPGDKVMIYGSGFTNLPNLYFWSGVAAGYVVMSDSQIIATVPPGITTGPLGVKLGTGSTFYTTNDYLAIGPGPYISSVTPTYGVTNDTGIIITGVHLTNSAGYPTVAFGGVAAPNRIPTADGTQITVTVPYGAHSGPVSVTTTAGGPTNGPNFLIIGPGPYITGFTPTAGTPGSVVFVQGELFTGVTNVTFNGVSGTNLVVQSETLIQISAPASVVTGPISVLAPLGVNTSVSNFFVPPTVTGMTPGFGRSGTNVIITGTSLSNTYTITFNGLASTDFAVLGNNSIRAAVPTGASDGLVRVIAPAGSAFSPSNFIVQPTMFGFTPGFGVPGVSSITITGANFNVGTPTVRFNGTTAAVSGVSFGQLTAVVPTGTTTGPISVSTTDGSHTNVATFYVPASITSFSTSNSPPGTPVTITGQNFLGASAVAFNGTPASFTPPTNNTTLFCVVPTNFSTGPVTVTVPAGIATSVALFYAAPVITNFTPTHGLPGTNVTIKGQSFVGTTAVRLSGSNMPIVSVNNTQIVATVPNFAQSGPIAVEAPAGTNTTATNFLLDYTSDVSVTNTAAPNPVFVGSNLVYTLVLANNGPWDAPNVQWTNQLSSLLDLVSVSVSAGTWSTNTGPITGNLGTLAVNRAATVTITVRPNTSGTAVDFTSMGSDNPDPIPGNNSLSVLSTVLPLPLLSIRQMTDQVRVSWPSTLTGYVLESKILMTPGAGWASNAGTSTLAGSIRYVMEPATNPAKYYRLHK